MKVNLNYTEGFTRLEVEGLPDHSLGQSPNTIGIIISWKLRLIGTSILQGEKEHLQNLISVISTYSNSLISGKDQYYSDPSKSVSISTHKRGHQLKLVSKKEGIAPLIIYLDDAELSDLTKCLDHVLNDTKLAIDWEISKASGLRSSRLKLVKLIYRQLSMPLIASLVFLISAFMLALIPEPQTEEFNDISNNMSFLYKQMGAES